MLIDDLHTTNSLGIMKDSISSVVAYIIWYSLVCFLATGLMVASLVLLVLSLAAGIVIGVPVLLGWCVVRYLRHRQSLATLFPQCGEPSLM